MAKVTYNSKVNIITQPVPEENKVTAGNLNEIKTAINDNFDLLDAKAELNGNSLETFKVADATLTTEAINKGQLDSAISNVVGGIIIKGNWNADTNTPDITGTTTSGWGYIVTVDGSTDLDGENDWKVTDVAVKTDDGWAKIDNTDKVSSVAGKTGVVTLDLDDVSDSATRKALTTGTQTILGQKTFNDTSTFGELFANDIFVNYGLILKNITTGVQVVLIQDLITEDRIVRIPDANGVLALTSDIPTVDKTTIDALGIDAETLEGLTPTQIRDLVTKAFVDALGINATELNGETKEDILANVDATTLNQVSAKSLSFAESYIQNYRSRLLDEGYTYFPNSSAYRFARLKELNVQNEASIVIGASGVKTSLLPAVKGLPLDFTRTGEASYTDENGVMQTALENVPRVTYDENGDESILIEPARKNLFLNSETGVTQTITVLSGRNYAVSFSGTGSITFSGGATGTLNGIVSNTLDRVSEIKTTTSTSVTCTITGDVNFVNFEINTDNSSVSYDTTWIKTLGASATRNAELVSKTGLADYINSDEGVFTIYTKLNGNSSNNKGISLGDGTINNRIFIYYSAVENQIIAQGWSGGSNVFFFTHLLSSSLEYNEISVKYKTNDFALWVNGEEVDTDDTGNAPIGLNALYFNTGTGLSPWFGEFKDIKIFKEALTDDKLQNLKTL